MSSPSSLLATDVETIILYDGVCGLCNRFNQFVLRRDTKAVFRFASLQSPLAAAILKRHPGNSQELQTVCVVLNPNRLEERVLARSDAVIFVLKRLGGLCRIAGRMIGAFPRSVRDWGYSLVARNRYRFFGRYDVCPVPAPNHRERFLESPNQPSGK
jgi:predicted DCC family thiol-disulfide oxidoreductase YuxK